MAMDDPENNLVVVEEPKGFLPIYTNAFDRVFISIVVFVALHLLWMRFVEAYASLYIATALSVVIGWVIIKRG
jgi:predicted small integral membrane protein